MSMRVEFTIEGLDDIVSKRKMPTLLNVIAGKMNLLSIALEKKIVNEKLSGQVLERRTGRLADSVHAVPSTIEGTTVTGGVVAGGAEAPYAAWQNYGTDRSYEIKPVNKKALAFLPLSGARTIVPVNKVFIAKILKGFQSPRGSIRKKAYASADTLGGQVVSKVIHPPLEARNFMESSIDEFRPTFTADMTKAIFSALRLDK